MYYSVQLLHDGTVIAAYPIRKPSPKMLKRDGMRIDEDGRAMEYSRNGVEIGDPGNPTRMRFQDIIAANLNTRRAIRELAGGPLDDLCREMRALRAEVAQLREAVAGQADACRPSSATGNKLSRNV
ncbi:MAG: hypothetical protein U0636_00070 [Phycisphaerales bacterium]